MKCSVHCLYHKMSRFTAQRMILLDLAVGFCEIYLQSVWSDFIFVHVISLHSLSLYNQTVVVSPIIQAKFLHLSIKEPCVHSCLCSQWATHGSKWYKNTGKKVSVYFLGWKQRQTFGTFTWQLEVRTMGASVQRRGTRPRLSGRKVSKYKNKLCKN